MTQGLSLCSGVLLSIAGVIGLSGIFSGDWRYFIGSCYAIFFGLIVLVRPASQGMVAG